MKNWHGKTSDGAYAVQLPKSVLCTLDHFCHEAGRLETGGILIGHYSEDLSVAVVREATPPPSDSSRGRSWFVRGMAGLRELLGKKWQAAERTHYVGEWHFHPVEHVEPSRDDFEQMVSIGQAKAYDCKEPLLIILGTGQQGGTRIFRAFVCPTGQAPLELLRKDELDE